MKTKKTVVVKLKGGMGNQMFQYAFGKMLEKTAAVAGTPITLLFDTTAFTNPPAADTKRPYMLEPLSTTATIADDKTALSASNPYGIFSQITRKILQKCNLGNPVAYIPSLLQPPYRGYYEGYWQSEKYFLPMVAELRKEFTLKAPLGKVGANLKEMIMNDANAVSIFYRRTDYVGNKTFDIGEQDYQTRAIAHMRTLVPNMKLYVMSDDIAWVKEHADLPAGSVFVSSKDLPFHEEMYIASVCKHNIIPNSTFCWWGAWLNINPNKIVIAPKNWANSKTDEYKDITPPSWLRI